MATLDSRLWAALAGFTGFAAPQSGGFVSGDQQQAATLGLQLLQQQSNQLYAFPMAQAPEESPQGPPGTNPKRPGPSASSGAARQRKSVMNKKQQMIDLEVKVDAYSQQAKEIEAANSALRQRQSLLNQLVALASMPLRKAEPSPASGFASACDKAVAADVLAVHAAVEHSHGLSVREFLLVSEAYVRAATPLFTSDDPRHASVLACLTTAYRQIVEYWEMHHLQEAYEMRNMNLGAYIATNSAVFLDQDDAHWADICAATHAREGLMQWARPDIERQRQSDLQCIVEVCKEGLGRKLSGVMVTLLLDLLARRALPVRSLAALVVESWPYRSNPVHMFKAPAVVFRPPPPAPLMPLPPLAPVVPPPATELSIAPPPLAAAAAAAPAVPEVAAPAMTELPAAPALQVTQLPSAVATQAMPIDPQVSAAPQPNDPMDMDASAPAEAAPATATTAAEAPAPEALAAAGAAATATGGAAAGAAAATSAAATGAAGAAEQAPPEGTVMDLVGGKIVPAGKPKKKGAQRDTESLAAQALMMMAGK